MGYFPCVHRWPYNFLPDLRQHLLHLEQVFKCLREANVRLKPSKCHFVEPEVEYLGHVVSSEGLKPNPKIRAVQEFPIQTFQELRAILCKNQTKWGTKNFDLPLKFAWK